MASSSAIRKQIDIKTEQKRKIDYKIELLTIMINKMEECMTSVNEEKYSLHHINMAIEGFETGEDSSYGSMIDYFIETEQKKKAKFEELDTEITSWIEKMQKEENSAKELKKNLMDVSEQLSQEISQLWSDYYRALEEEAMEAIKKLVLNI